LRPFCGEIKLCIKPRFIPTNAAAQSLYRATYYVSHLGGDLRGAHCIKLGAQPKHFARVTAIVGVRGKKGGGGKACVRPDTANENVTNALAPYVPSSTEYGDIQ